MPFKKGVSGNPHGQPRKPEVELVRKAIEETNREKKKSLWKHLIEQCYEDNNVLVAVAKKFLPDNLNIKIEDGKFIIVRADGKSLKENENI